MRAAQAGDRESYRALLDDIAPGVRAFLRRTLGDRDDADDAFQDTLLALHRYRHTYKPGRSFDPWLFAIARNVARDHLRRRGVQRWREVHPTVLPEQAAELDPGFDERLRQGFASLSPSQREAIALVKLEGRSVSDAAEQAGTTPGALKVRVHRAYVALKRFLES